jgi:hypothetical protein
MVHPLRMLYQYNEPNASAVPFGCSDDDEYGNNFRTIMSLVSHMILPERICFDEVVHVLHERGYFDQDGWPSSMCADARHQLFTQLATQLTVRCCPHFEQTDAGKTGLQHSRHAHVRVRHTSTLQCATGGVAQWGARREHAHKPLVCAERVEGVHWHAHYTFIIQIYNGRQTQVRALRDIAAGEELTASYGPRYGKKPRADRRQWTKFGYDFVCDCEVHALATYVQYA